MANDGDYYFPLMRYFRYSMKCFSLRFTTSVVFKRINFGFGFVDYIAANINFRKINEIFL